MGRHAKDGSYGYHTKEAKCPKCRAKLKRKDVDAAGSRIWFLFCEKKCGYWYRKQES